MQADVILRSGTTYNFPGYKAVQYSEGWVRVTDEYNQVHAFPSDTVAKVNEIPRPRW